MRIVLSKNQWKTIGAQAGWDLSWYYNVETAQNTKDPEILRNILERGNNDEVSWDAVANPNCSPETLRMVLERQWNSISRGAAFNPNCPPDALKMVLERGNNDDISYYASQNPNAPFESVIKWMRDTGRITKEDPSIHLIDQPEQPKPRSNTDLEELERLLQAEALGFRK